VPIGRPLDVVGIVVRELRRPLPVARPEQEQTAALVGEPVGETTLPSRTNPSMYARAGQAAATYSGT
jgi:hypothetical protein